MTLNVLPVVLVVDDDRGQVVLVTLFPQKARFRVVGASSAGQALAGLAAAGDASHAISFLLTDRDVPGRRPAAQLVKNHPTLKVLYVTVNADVLLQQGRELGAHEAFLEKPVSAKYSIDQQS